MGFHESWETHLGTNGWSSWGNRVLAEHFLAVHEARISGGSARSFGKDLMGSVKIGRWGKSQQATSKSMAICINSPQNPKWKCDEKPAIQKPHVQKGHNCNKCGPVRPTKPGTGSKDFVGVVDPECRPGVTRRWWSPISGTNQRSLHGTPFAGGSDLMQF